jgi:hypothetical protein
MGKKVCDTALAPPSLEVLYANALKLRGLVEDQHVIDPGPAGFTFQETPVAALPSP